MVEMTEEMKVAKSDSLKARKMVDAMVVLRDCQ